MGLFSFLSENGKGFTTLLSHDQLIFEVNKFECFMMTQPTFYPFAFV
jgi:hypothetical protein